MNSGWWWLWRRCFLAKKREAYSHGEQARKARTRSLLRSVSREYGQQTREQKKGWKNPVEAVDADDLKNIAE